MSVTNKPFDMATLADALRDLKPLPTQELFLSRGMRDAMIREAFALQPELIPREPLLSGGFRRTTFMGFGVELHDIPPELVYDWSGCRSPARAQRRHKMGHPQRVRMIKKEVAFLVDPAVLRGYQYEMERRLVKLVVGEAP